MKILSDVQLSGTSTAPTAPSGTSNGQIATTAFVQTEIALLGGSGNTTSIELMLDNVVNTIAYPTFTNGDITKIEHKVGSTIVRTDTFTYATNLITETRVLSGTGESVILKYYLDTLNVEVIYSS